MDRLDCIQSFVRVVETGSFSAVAKEFSTTQPAISKQIAALEEYLDVQLLTRSTRKLQLTQEGEHFLAHCQLLLDAASEAIASVGKRQNLTGKLRVNCSVSFGQYQIIPYLKEFLSRYPELQLDLSMSDRFIDFLEEGIDLAIRIGEVSNPNLILHRIGITRRVTVGSVDYFRDRQEPKTPVDLLEHNCIVYSNLTTGNNWHFQLPAGGSTQVTVKGNLQVDSSNGIREAILSGLGIAVCPVWVLGDLIHSEDIQVILKDYQPISLPIYAVYRRGRFIPAKVRCFIEYFTDKFKLNPWVSGL
ncbi:LysR family transcriptional regulator [Pseudanabaena sp. 'Roaring Creek']|uniref:LysR family transcriptional regulator n=1 Tax=Pseudanabaena sp. 'Roaring Creek' TaxID=1681830 RepID=UPI0006D7F123